MRRSLDGQAAGLGAGVGEVAERPGRQVVDDVDRLALGDQTLDEVRPDEPGTADDQHAALRRRRLRRRRRVAAAAAASSDTGSVARFGDPGVGVLLTVGNDGVGADHRANEPGAAPDRARHDRALDDRVGADHRARAAAPNRSPRRRRRPSTRRRRCCRRPTASACTEAPGARRRTPRPTRSGSRRPLTRSRLACRNSSRPTGVDPVVLGRQRVEPTVGGDQRERLPLDRDPPTGRDALEHARLEDVGAGVDQVARLGARAPASRRTARCDPCRRARRRRTPTGPRRGSGGSWPRRRRPGGRRRGRRSTRSVRTSPLATTNVSSMPAWSAAKRMAPAVSSGSGSMA